MSKPLHGALLLAGLKPRQGVMRGNVITLHGVHVGCAHVLTNVHMYFNSLCLVLTWYFLSALLIFLS